MAINVSLLKEICETSGAPGSEGKVRKIVEREVRSLVDDFQTDNMGNLFAIKKGKSPSKRVMAAAHMDEIGFIVKHIDDEGFIRFHTLGGFDPKTLTAQRVIIHGKKDIKGVMGCKPIHVMTQEERGKPALITDYFIDTGMSKKELDKYVGVGNTVTRDCELIEIGDCVNCKSIDNRVAVFILIETLKKLKKIPFDFYGVFTVQEEVGIRGASVAAHTIEPDFGFGIDTTVAYDYPEAKDHEMITKLGDGTAIKIMDSSTICDTRMVDFMKKTATKNNIKWQLEVLPMGGTDTAGVQRMGKGGSIAGAVSIPTRYLHQHIEMANKSDIENSIKLLTKCTEGLDGYKWDLK